LVRDVELVGRSIGEQRDELLDDDPRAASTSASTSLSVPDFMVRRAMSCT
jgi:hypothetical protein